MAQEKEIKLEASEELDKDLKRFQEETNDALKETVAAENITEGLKDRRK